MVFNFKPFDDAKSFDDIMNESDFMDRISSKVGMELVDLDTLDVNSSGIGYMTDSQAKQNRAVPIDFKNNTLTVAIDDHLNTRIIEELRITKRINVTPVLVSKQALDSLIEKFYSARTQEKSQQAIKDFSATNTVDETDSAMSKSDVQISNAPVVRLVNSIINDSIAMHGSDIHIEPFEHEIRVRVRVDGELTKLLTLPTNMLAGLVSRIKVMSNLNIAETMRPQDGRVKIQVGQSYVNMRISIIPTVFGEKVVIRILSGDAKAMDKTTIGLSPDNLRKVERIMKITEGIILLTGPTGSGKTTTLYSLLKDFNNMETNIITLEDPVEYQMFGVNQVQVDAKVGMTFAAGLRSILRQDPDVVMLGEIRDEETAQNAIRAAVTGHVVLSTLHTNDTASTVTRLIDMNIPRYLVASAVAGIIAQRLVKKICPKCKAPVEISEDEKAELGVTGPVTVYKGKGCSYCNNTGYKGRVAIHEVLVLDKKLKEMISTGCTDVELKKAAIESGMATLHDSARDLVLKGDITIDEMNKATFVL